MRRYGDAFPDTDPVVASNSHPEELDHNCRVTERIIISWSHLSHSAVLRKGCFLKSQGAVARDKVLSFPICSPALSSLQHLLLGKPFPDLHSTIPLMTGFRAILKAEQLAAN